MKKIISIFIFIFFFFPFLGLAQVHKWVDEAGRTHFTDDYSKVPLSYRGRKKKNKGRRLKGRIKRKKIDSVPSAAARKEKKTSRNKQTLLSYDFDPEDSSIYFTVILNNRTPAYFLLDTTVDTTSINIKTAYKLGLRGDFSKAERGNMATMIRLDSLRLGLFELKDQRVEVRDKIREADGILGKDILDEFSYKINPEKRELILEEKDSLINKKYGGHTEKWWKKEFFYVRTMLSKIKDLSARETNTKKKEKLREVKADWEIELKELQTKAIKAAVPLSWQTKTPFLKQEIEEKIYPDNDQKWWKNEYRTRKDKIKALEGEISELKKLEGTNPREFSYHQGKKNIADLEKQKEKELKKLEQLDGAARQRSIPLEWRR